MHLIMQGCMHNCIPSAWMYQRTHWHHSLPPVRPLLAFQLPVAVFRERGERGGCASSRINRLHHQLIGCSSLDADHHGPRGSMKRMHSVARESCSPGNHDTAMSEKQPESMVIIIVSSCCSKSLQAHTATGPHSHWATLPLGHKES